MRPAIKFLSADLIKKIISEATSILCQIGVEINNKHVISLLSDHGAKITANNSTAIFTESLIENAIKSVPKSFKLYDVLGNATHNFSDHNVHFTPGSAALHFLDPKTKRFRKPVTQDYVHYAKVVGQLEFIASQSTAFIPSDVPDKISDSYRLFLSLLYCEKPVVTGSFTIESFEVMKDFQIAIRGSEKDLAAKPLTIFSCCPTSPLKWNDVTSQNVLDCARYAIPIELIAMPLSGFIAPVTLTGTLIQHTAETLSGITISQLANPGTPVLYGGSPAIFDMRNQTTPMGAIETMMIDCAYNEIGKYLGLPTQAYISLSDANQLDAQAGLESGIGATLAALAGINNISGPGMLDFENCFNLEKLIVDNEICRMVFRLIKGISPRDDFPALPLFQELLKEKHLIISEHTQNHLREEHIFPEPVINRMTRSQWEEKGSLILDQRATQQIDKLLAAYQPSQLSQNTKQELIKLMQKEAARNGLDQLPAREN
jgi:trimethylamine--corrinoid protein Co-methyltransferase